MTTVAVLGTGKMGAGMAGQLLQHGHEVRAWNRSRDKAEPLAEDGATVSDEPAEAVRGAEVVLVMLYDADSVIDVLQQAAPGMTEQTVVVQCSTVGLDSARVAEAAAGLGVRLLDAPVLGTKGPAEEGALVVLASGDPAVLERLAPLFDAVGSRTMLLGEAGAGTRFKLVMNHWVLTVTDAIAETIAFAEGVDLDPALYLEAIAGGPLDLGYAHLKGPGMIAGDLPVAFPLKHALKDAELILEAAERHELDLALAETVRDRYAQAADEGHADEDMAMVVAATRATSAR
jgi:3-hydroxyisobutyrate dehydrogenase